MSVQFKSVPVSVTNLDADTGRFQALVSVTNVVDNGNDVILPGAYEKTLKTRVAKVCFGHDWKLPVGKVLSAKELLPGDRQLPQNLRDMDAGALWVDGRFNLATQRGREAYEDVKFWSEPDGSGTTSEWSIGYDCSGSGEGGKARAYKGADGIRYIKELDWLECSPVLFGMAENTTTLSLKSMLAEAGIDADTYTPLEKKQIWSFARGIKAAMTEGGNFNQPDPAEDDDQVIAETSGDDKPKLPEVGPGADAADEGANTGMDSQGTMQPPAFARSVAVAAGGADQTQENDEDAYDRGDRGAKIWEAANAIAQAAGYKDWSEFDEQRGSHPRAAAAKPKPGESGGGGDGPAKPAIGGAVGAPAPPPSVLPTPAVASQLNAAAASAVGGAVGAPAAAAPAVSAPPSEGSSSSPPPSQGASSTPPPTQGAAPEPEEKPEHPTGSTRGGSHEHEGSGALGRFERNAAREEHEGLGADALGMAGELYRIFRDGRMLGGRLAEEVTGEKIRTVILDPDVAAARALAKSYLTAPPLIRTTPTGPTGFSPMKQRWLRHLTLSRKTQRSTPTKTQTADMTSVP